VNIAIPGSVDTIGDSAFKKCDGLGQRLMNENASLVRMWKEAFADCHSLRSFCFPKTVREVDEDCFIRCGPLDLLIFDSGVSLKSIVGDVSLDDALVKFGFVDITSSFTIEGHQEAVDLGFPGWIWVDDNGSCLGLIQANK
jgi:hypothetical protein